MLSTPTGLTPPLADCTDRTGLSSIFHEGWLTPEAAAHDAPWLLNLLTGALDELDYGLLLLDRHGRLVQANRAGLLQCQTPANPCCLRQQCLHARHSADDVSLQKAIQQALHQGRRSLVEFGGRTTVRSVAVVPLLRSAVVLDTPTAISMDKPVNPNDAEGVLLVFGKEQVCQPLSLEHFAHGHGLTHAESMVLGALCSGDDPAQVACRFGVAVSTVRTQIASIRQKTRVDSICDLVRQIATLPPLVPALRHGPTHRTHRYQ